MTPKLRSHRISDVASIWIAKRFQRQGETRLNVAADTPVLDRTSRPCETERNRAEDTSGFQAAPPVPSCPVGVLPVIRHIVFFSARTPADRDAVEAGLNLLAGIPDCLHFEVGRNFATDPISPDGPDFVVYGEFRDEAQLARWKAHPLYQKSIDVVRPLRDLRMAADFESPVKTVRD
tara:strand:+ start:1167 stop:1697 length:531 start_codon:yes stop_codon:yes gene_type:complete